jgi:hypothetical protein
MPNFARRSEVFNRKKDNIVECHLKLNCSAADCGFGSPSRSASRYVQKEETTMSQSERWHIRGSAPEMYEAKLVPAIFAPWAPLLVAKAALRESERVLDVACGQA